ncbi:sugar ABC transporter substrate-binding protein [Mycetocola tolaasinivorans]|uniref:Sugar ABC transporter substrate-binding protein n=1 Tax=Mycetocola tolaasinivorans TaxID=76635 RepID=A0A3L7A2M5_9MICO|nr:sugar ABC transporter substrate-binding protein [Mycetocola tolaasinivorans]RLP74563.1 sugar ABC transporter substrate-binding protein [Mycetocola tolaasinivorans]
MNTRRLASLGVAALTAAALLTGCSTSGGSADGNSVTWWVPNWDAPAAKELVADFTKANPEIKVKLVETTADTLANKVSVALNSGTTPDVITELASRTQQYIAKDQLTNLDKLYTDAMPKSDFLPGTLADVSTGDKAFAVPYRWDNLGLFYNKDLFEKAGITEPPTTLDELKADAEKLSTGDTTGIGWQLGNSDSTILRFFGLAASAPKDPATNVDGAAHLTESSSKAALDIIGASVRDGWASKSSLEADSTAVRQLFINGQIGMYLGGVYDLVELQKNKMNVGTALAPGFDGPSKTAANGWVYLVPKASKNVSAAEKLVSYLTTPEAMNKLTLTFPARTSAAQDDRFHTDLAAPFAAQLSDHSIPAPYDPSWGKLAPTLFAQIQAVAIGQSTSEEAAKTIQQAADAALKGK